MIATMVNLHNIKLRDHGVIRGDFSAKRPIADKSQAEVLVREERLHRPILIIVGEVDILKWGGPPRWSVGGEEMKCYEGTRCYCLPEVAAPDMAGLGVFVLGFIDFLVLLVERKSDIQL